MSDEILLLIEDEANLRNSLRFILEEQGFSVFCAESGEAGLVLALEHPPDLALVDIGLPGMDGFDVARRLGDQRRSRGLRIVFLTGSDEEDDMVRAFEGLADDYIVKPVRPRVLMARIRSLLRRDPIASAADDAPVVCGPLRMDPAAFEAAVQGRDLALTSTEFKILLLLARQPGKAFSRARIISAVHGEDCHLTEKAVDFQIHSLRRKLGEHAALLHTVRGVGFKLRVS